MSDIIEVIKDVTTVTIASDGPQGPAGPTGPTGPEGAAGAPGSSGVISVVAPITNTGTSTSAIIGINAGVANGVATLDSSGLVPTNQLPALAITNTFVVASQAAMLALTAETGDVAIRTDLNESYILTASPASTLANWQELLTPPDAVSSVDGRVGNVTLSDLYAGLASANTFTLGPNTFQSGGAANVGLIVRGATSQTADVQNWRDGSGANIMRVTSTGSLILNSGQGISSQYITGVSQGNGAYIETSSTNMSIRTRAATNVGLIIKGAASQTANLQEWQDSTGTVMVAVTSAGAVKVGTSISGVFAINNIINGGSIVLAVRGASGQSANLQEWQNSAGTVLANINSGGELTTPNMVIGALGGIYNSSGGSYIQFTATAATFNPYGAAKVGVIVKGAASQTANLQEWQNSAATILASVSSSGYLRSTVGFASTVDGITYIRTNFDTSGIAVVTQGAAQKGLIVRGAASQTANLQEWQDSGGGLLGYVASGGVLRAEQLQTNGANVWLRTTNGGGVATFQRTTTAPSNVAANYANLYFRDGTVPGTLKLVVRAGAAGAETTIYDNIPQ